MKCRFKEQRSQLSLKFIKIGSVRVLPASDRFCYCCRGNKYIRKRYKIEEKMENYENESKKTSTKRRKNINFNFYIFSITAAHRYKYWEKVEKNLHCFFIISRFKTLAYTFGFNDSVCCERYLWVGSMILENAGHKRRLVLIHSETSGKHVPA